MKRIYLIGAVISISIVLVGCQPEEEKKESVPMKQVGARELLTEDFEHWVELQGALESDNDVMLTPQTAGTISRIYVKEGQKVRRGQIIAYMDSDIISSNVEEVQTALENAEYVYDKQVALYERGVGTEFDTTQAYNQVQSLKRKISTLRTQAGKSAVVAPFDGYVEEVYPSQGEVGGPGMPICHLVGLNTIRATAAISESYFRNIGKGSLVSVEVPALDTAIEQEITRVSKYVNPNNRTYQIHIDLDNKNESLVPNLVAKIAVLDKLIEGAKVVESRSIQYDKDGNPYVYWLELKAESDEEASEEDEEATTKYVAHLSFVESLSSYRGMTAIRIIDAIPAKSKIVTIGAEGIQDGEEVVISF